VADNWLDVYRGMPQRAPTRVAPPSAPTAQSQPSTGVQITSVTGARPGGSGRVVAQTQPGASCSIAYTTPAGTRSTAQGLNSKTADSNGMASWSWSIGPSTRPGSGTVVVTCDGQSASTAIQIG
jgi:hypothetical protein